MILARFQDGLIRKLQYSIALQEDELPGISSPVSHKASVHTRRALRRFSKSEVDRFHVNGASIPHVSFDVGDSWSGLLPISADPHETRKLFFWYFPPTANGSENDLIFWTNGGPGCSSLEGFLQENGVTRPHPSERMLLNRSPIAYQLAVWSGEADSKSSQLDKSRTHALG
jgi:carboxypeptidase C (cathepsin A)